MDNYIELAHSTSAPVPPCRERLKGPLLALLCFRLLELREITESLDQLKRAIFYGKPEIGSKLIIDTGDEENALHAFRDDAMVELLHAGLGMATEAGEFLDAIFAATFGGATLDKVNIVEEVGDSLWYLAKAAKFTGTTLEFEMIRNIAKLAKRFPDKFTDAAALVRNLDGERAALESSGGRAEQRQGGAPDGTEPQGISIPMTRKQFTDELSEFVTGAILSGDFDTSHGVSAGVENWLRKRLAE